MVKKNPKHYIDKEQLFKAVVEQQRINKEAKDNGLSQPQYSDYIGRSIIAICENLAKKGNFAGYSYRSDLVGNAILNIFKYFDKFDETKTQNVFAYWTTIAYYSMLQTIKKEKLQQDIKFAALETAQCFESLADFQGADGNDYDSNSNSIRNYRKDYVDSSEDEKLNKNFVKTQAPRYMKDRILKVKSSKLSSNTLNAIFVDEV